MQWTFHTGLADPLQVSIEFPFNLLLSSKLQELSPVLHTLPFFGKLPKERNTQENDNFTVYNINQI